MRINVKTNSDTIILQGTDIVAKTDNRVYRYPLSDVEEILILTTDAGPVVDDMYLVLRLAGGLDLYVTSSHPVYSHFLFDELGKVLTLDNESIIAASSCVENGFFSIYKKRETSNELIAFVDRESVCEEDSVYDHGRPFRLSPEAKCENLCQILIESNYFPEISGCSAIWELVSLTGERVFTWYTQTGKKVFCHPEKKVSDFVNNGACRFKARFFPSPFLYEERLLNLLSSKKDDPSAEELSSQIEYCRELIQTEENERAREEEAQPDVKDPSADVVPDTPKEPVNIAKGIAWASLGAGCFAYLLMVFGQIPVFGGIITAVMLLPTTILYRKHSGDTSNRGRFKCFLLCGVLVVAALILHNRIFHDMTTMSLLVRMIGYLSVLTVFFIIVKFDDWNSIKVTPYTAKDIRETIETYKEETARPWPAELRRLQGILLGEIEPGAMVREMKDFFADAFSCTMLDCYLGDFSDRRTVCFVLESFADLDKLRMQGSREFDAEKLTKIREKYSELCRKYGADKNCQNPNWYYALPVTAERELKCIVIGESFDDLEKAIAEFPLVKGHQYYYDRIYVVYESAEATRKNESNGVSKEISEKVLSVLKEHDRFGIVHSVDIAFVPVEDEPVHRPIGFSSGE